MSFPAKLAALFLLSIPWHLACSSDTHVVMARAPGIDLSGANVSVFGVYSEGRWNAAAWDRLGPRLSTLGKSPCEPGFGEGLRNSDKELFVAIDREARANGVTEKALQQLSVGANGDVVLVLELWGALGTVSNSAPGPVPPTGAGGMPGGSGMAGGGMGGGRVQPGGYSGLGGGPKEQDALRLVARVYAPETNEWVGAVEVRYSGSDPNEAIARFDEELGHLLPRANCSGWTWKGHAPSVPAPSASAATSSAPSTAPSVSPSSSPSSPPKVPDLQ